jgi:hypothetical protein
MIAEFWSQATRFEGEWALDPVNAQGRGEPYLVRDPFEENATEAAPRPGVSRGTPYYLR